LVKKPEWTIKMMEANVYLCDLDMSNIFDHLERLEAVNGIERNPGIMVIPRRKQNANQNEMATSRNLPANVNEPSARLVAYTT
jgi:hypothetical protein